jgi:hypothetical protein
MDVGELQQLPEQSSIRMPRELDRQVSREMSRAESRVYISLDVEKDRAVFRGYWDKDASDRGSEFVEDAPTTENLREILEWAFERTGDVLVRLDWAGSYWRAKRMTTAPSPSDLEGEIFLAGEDSNTAQ